MHNIARHEGIDVHELLVFKNTLLTKSFTMLPLIADQELKDIFKQDIETSRNQINQLKGFIETAMSQNNKGDQNA